MKPILLALCLAPLAAIAQPDSLAPAKPAESAQPKPAASPAFIRHASGKSIVLPDELKTAGTAYHTVQIPGKQVTFTSKALNAKFDGHSSAVIGYAVAGPADNPAALKGGLWALPVKSLDTGNRTRDRHIAGKDWLDAATSPDIVFVLKEVKDIKAHKETAAGKSFTATLVGEMTIKGVTKPLTITEATLGFVTGTDKTAAIAKGDLLAIRCKYTVKLTDFGVDNENITKNQTVADEIEIDQSLTLSTVPPEDQPQKSEGEKPAEKKN